MERINQGAVDLGGHWLKATDALGNVVEVTEDTRRTLLAAYMTQDDSKAFQENKANFMNYKTKWETDFTTYETVTSSEGKTRVAAMRKSFGTYMADCDQIWKLLEEGKVAEARPIVMNQSKASFELVLKDMGDQMVFQSNGGAQAVVDAQTAHNNGTGLLLIFSAIAVVGGGLLAFIWHDILVSLLWQSQRSLRQLQKVI